MWLGSGVAVVVAYDDSIAALIWPLVWGLPYATGIAEKKKKRTEAIIVLLFGNILKGVCVLQVIYAHWREFGIFVIFVVIYNLRWLFLQVIVTRNIWAESEWSSARNVLKVFHCGWKWLYSMISNSKILKLLMIHYNTSFSSAFTSIN